MIKEETDFTLTREDGTTITGLSANEAHVLVHGPNYLELLTNFVEKMMSIHDNSIHFGHEIKGTLIKELGPIYKSSKEQIEGMENDL